VPLEKYKAKRNFTRTPEPAGDSGLVEQRARARAGRTARFFCVQKHLASHLHYDVRLEHDGVLLSWAVPKGPSLDPAIKRLAMHVEDHPVEYGDFEGIIPSGYGAGIVMLWDRGTWTPEVDDVDAALKKGDLKFTLDGYKLKGSWVLVRTRSWGGGSSAESWLLIKHRDDWSGPVDITEFAPLSVKTKQDFAGILAEGDPDIWRSNRPAATGDTGQMFARIIAQALAMRAGTTEAANADIAPAKAGPATRSSVRIGARTAKETGKSAAATTTSHARTKSAGVKTKSAGVKTTSAGAKKKR
jgi:DNA ligase D-like protein (predicted 3'-phosphoesterase)